MASIYYFYDLILSENNRVDSHAERGLPKTSNYFYIYQTLQLLLSFFSKFLHAHTLVLPNTFLIGYYLDKKKFDFETT